MRYYNETQVEEYKLLQNIEMQYQKLYNVLANDHQIDISVMLTGYSKGLKGVYSCLWNAPQSYEASLAIWNHTVLPATRHKWTRPALTTARQAGTRFTYPGGMEGELTEVVGCMPRCFLSGDSHPSK